MAEPLHAGVGKAAINPPPGLQLTGWEYERRNRGVHQDILVKTLALGSGGDRALVVTLDLLGLLDPEAGVLRRRIAEATGVPGGHILLAASHTHSGPMIGPLNMPLGARPDPAYEDGVHEAAARSAQAALQALEPVTVGRGGGRCTFAVNRRLPGTDGRVLEPPHANPAGPVDHDVPVVRFDRTSDGSPLAVVFSYGCHPTVWGPGELVSPDYPGPARGVIEAHFGPGTESFFLLGCCGDVRSNFTVPGGRFDWQGTAERVESAGRMLGEEAVRVSENMTRGDASPEGGIRAAVTRVTLPFPPTVERPPRVDATFQALRLGPFLLVASPAETFVETGRTVRAALGGAALLATCANGFAGYVPPPAAYAEGGYEVTGWTRLWAYPAPFAPDVEAIFIENMLETARAAGRG